MFMPIPNLRVLPSSCSFWLDLCLSTPVWIFSIFTCFSCLSTWEQERILKRLCTQQCTKHLANASQLTSLYGAVWDATTILCCHETGLSQYASMVLSIWFERKGVAQKHTSTVKVYIIRNMDPLWNTKRRFRTLTPLPSLADELGAACAVCSIYSVASAME